MNKRIFLLLVMSFWCIFALMIYKNVQQSVTEKPSDSSAPSNDLMSEQHKALKNGGGIGEIKVSLLIENDLEELLKYGVNHLILTVKDKSSGDFFRVSKNYQFIKLEKNFKTEEYLPVLIKKPQSTISLNETHTQLAIWFPQSMWQTLKRKTVQQKGNRGVFELYVIDGMLAAKLKELRFDNTPLKFSTSLQYL